MRRWIPAACAAALVCAACFFPYRPRLPVSAFDAADSLAPYMPELLSRTDVPGAAVAIVRDGDVQWARGFGWADIEHRVPLTDTTVMQVASISKSVTAWGVMRLVERQHVSLTAPIDSIVTRWHLPAAKGIDARGATVARVLSHTAGLSPNAYTGYVTDSAMPTLLASLAGHNDGVGDVHFIAAPATRWSYSEGGYEMLQLMIEDVTGRPFAEYMRDEVLAPLGMRRSAFVWSAALRPQTATPYDEHLRVIPVHRFVEEAADGLYTTPRDLARFVAAPMADAHGAAPGRGVLSPATVALMLTKQPATNDTPWGLGYQLWPAGDDLVGIGHYGTNPGWRAIAIGFPDLRRGLVVMTNGDNGYDVIQPLVCAWARSVTGETISEC